MHIMILNQWLKDALLRVVTGFSARTGGRRGRVSTEHLAVDLMHKCPSWIKAAGDAFDACAVLRQRNG